MCNLEADMVAFVSVEYIISLVFCAYPFELLDGSVVYQN